MDRPVAGAHPLSVSDLQFYSRTHPHESWRDRVIRTVADSKFEIKQAIASKAGLGKWVGGASAAAWAHLIKRADDAWRAPSSAPPPPPPPIDRVKVRSSDRGIGRDAPSGPRRRVVKAARGHGPLCFQLVVSGYYVRLGHTARCLVWAWKPRRVSHSLLRFAGSFFTKKRSVILQPQKVVEPSLGGWENITNLICCSFPLIFLSWFRNDHVVLPPSQIVSHSKDLRKSNFSMFDQIYIMK